MVLREFLVAITFQVNNAKAFQSSMTLATTGFGALSKAAAGAAVAVAAAVGKVADDLDKLYFMSQRTRASADNIAALGYAARQTGSSAEAMGSSIENVASRLRRLPGLTQMLANMGIDGRGDPTQTIIKLQQRMSALPQHIQLLYADLFGIDEKTWLALKNMGAYIQERQMIAKSMGVDMDRAAKSANTLWTEFRRLGTTIEVMAAKAVDSLGVRYAKTFRNFTDMLVRNGDRIASVIERLVDLFLKLVEAIGAMFRAFGRVGSVIYEWFERLDPAIQNTIKGLGLLLIAWRLLSVGMLATPLGRILAALAGAVMLVEDYLVFKERGQGENGSQHDWSWLEDNVFTQIGDAMRKAGEYARAGWQWLIDITEWFRTSSIGQRLLPPGGQPRQGDGEWDRYGRVMQGESLWSRIRRGLGIGSAEASPSAMRSERLATARRVDGILADMGYNPAQRAGMLASIGRESGFDPNASIIDNNGLRSHGLFQHNGPRLDAMMRAFGVSDPRQLTMEQQLLWMHHEMTAGGEASRAGRFLGATEPGAAGRAFSRDLIRPLDRDGAEAERRGRDAERWRQHLDRPTGAVAPGYQPASLGGGGGGGANVALNPVAYINVTTPDSVAAARQVLAGQDQLHQNIVRNFRARVV